MQRGWFRTVPGALRAAACGALLSLSSLAPAHAQVSEWKQVHSERAYDLKVFSRERPGSAVRELRATALLDVPAPQVLSFLADTAGQPGNLPPLESAQLLRRDGDEELYHMTVYLRWVSRRDYCVRIAVRRAEAGRGEVTWTQDDAGCPAPSRGIVRMRHNTGTWHVEEVTLPDGNRGARIVYQALTDPGGAVPAWIVNRASPGSLVHTFTAIRRAASQPRYASR